MHYHHHHYGSRCYEDSLPLTWVGFTHSHNRYSESCRYSGIFGSCKFQINDGTLHLTRIKIFYGDGNFQAGACVLQSMTDTGDKHFFLQV